MRIAGGVISAAAALAFVAGAGVAVLLAVFAIADASQRGDYQTWWGYAVALMIPGAALWWWRREHRR